MPLSTLISRLFQIYWRQSRGLDLAVACCLEDERRQVMLTRGADGLWTWPRVQVRSGESSRQALSRLERSLNIAVNGEPRLISIDEPKPPGSPYVALYGRKLWRSLEASGATETSPWQAFAIDALPSDVNGSVRHRLDEVSK